MQRHSLGAVFLLLACEATSEDPAGASGPSGSTPGNSGGSDGSTGDGDEDGGDGDVPLGGAAIGGSLGGASPASPGEYPRGPYGEANPRVGDVIENLTLVGFPRVGRGIVVGSESAQTMTLAELREGGESHALIHTATMWCMSCRAAADDLGQLGDQLSARGALIIELVLEAPDGSVPTPAQLGSWAAGSDLTVTTVAPGDDRAATVFPSREYVYIIELETMQVLWAEQAFFVNPTITQTGMDVLEGYLTE